MDLRLGQLLTLKNTLNSDIYLYYKENMSNIIWPQWKKIDRNADTYSKRPFPTSVVPAMGPQKM